MPDFCLHQAFQDLRLVKKQGKVSLEEANAKGHVALLDAFKEAIQGRRFDNYDDPVLPKFVELAFSLCPEWVKLNLNDPNYNVAKLTAAWRVPDLMEEVELPEEMPPIEKLIPTIPSPYERDYLMMERMRNMLKERETSFEKEKYLKAIVGKYGHAKISEAMRDTVSYDWKDFFQLALWSNSVDVFDTDLGRCVMPEDPLWNDWIEKGSGVNPDFIHRLSIYESDTKPNLLIKKFEKLFPLSNIDNEEAKEWIQRSKFFQSPELFFFHDKWPDKALRYNLLIIFLFEGDNPILKVNGDDLLSELKFEYEWTDKMLLGMFADGLGKFFDDKDIMTKLGEGGDFIATSVPILGSLHQLRCSKPTTCPIPETLVTEMMHHLLIARLGTFRLNYLRGSDTFARCLIESLKIGKRIILCAHFKRHGLIVEILRTQTDEYEVTILNSGGGISYHRELKVGEDSVRHEFFFKVKLTLQQIREKKYFYSSEMSMWEFYEFEPKDKLLDYEQSPDLVDTYGGQKHGTCAFKSANFFVKWLLKRDEAGVDKYGWYLWWKAWHISLRAKDLRANLGNKKVLKKNLLGLEKKWKHLKVSLDLLEDELSVADTIILHHCMRILSESKKLDEVNLRESILATLQTVELSGSAKDLLEAALQS